MAFPFEYRRCVRTDMAKRKRLADLEAMHQAAAADYWTLGAIEVAMRRPSSTHTPGMAQDHSRRMDANRFANLIVTGCSSCSSFSSCVEESLL